MRTKHVHLHGSISFYWFVDTDSDSELVWSPPSHLVWLDPSAQQVPFQRTEGCLEWLKLDLIALLGLLAFGCWEWPGLTMLKWWATNDLRSRSGLHNIQFTGKGLKPYEGFRISEPSTVSETSNRTGIQLLNDVKSTSRFLHHLHVSVACQRSSTEWESLEKPIETPPGSQGPLKHPSLSPWLVDGDVVLTPLAPLTELGCQALICAVICLKPSIIGMTNQLVLVPIADSWSYGYRKRVKNLVPLHTFHAKLSGIN